MRHTMEAMVRDEQVVKADTIVQRSSSMVLIFLEENIMEDSHK